MESDVPSPAMNDAPLRFPLILEELTRPTVSPQQLDWLLNLGWRHFGRRFFRYYLAIGDDRMDWVQPVRVNLTSLQLGGPAPADSAAER